MTDSGTGTTMSDDDLGTVLQHALADGDGDGALHGESKGAADWVKKNLFNTWYNSVITVVFGVFALWAGFYLVRFVFVTARWDPVRERLELFMVGGFPREERVRLLVQLFLTSGAVGMFAGWARARSIREAERAGVERAVTPWRDLIGVYWAISVFAIATLIVGARTIEPWLVFLGCIVTAIAAYMATLPLKRWPMKAVVLIPLAVCGVLLSMVTDVNNGAAYSIAVAATIALLLVNLAQFIPLTLSTALLAAVVGFQALTGTGGLAWLFLLGALTPLAVAGLDELRSRVPVWTSWVGVGILALALVWRWGVDGGFGLVPVVIIVLLIVAVGDALGAGDTAFRLGGLATIGVALFVIAKWLDVDEISWDEWGGLHLNLIVAGASIVLAFPFGLMLALGRRSSLPVVRWMSTVYIELIRGVPLITLLIMGIAFIGFFIDSSTGLLRVTRATTAFTLFSAAYIAEVVRGGLQSVEKGQTEAGQALGMSPGAITQLLVLPQALRNVIPAMVGQFISLFKDTSLLVIIGIADFLGVREIVHANAEFRGFGIAETLVFVAFGFWAVSFTMSRESQRLERRLSAQR